MNELLIRPAEFEELESLYCLSGIADIQRNHPWDRIDLKKIADGYSDSRHLFERNYHADNEVCLVIEAPSFDADFPIYGSNGHQIAGFVSAAFRKCRIYNHCILEDLYTVKSPYQTGKFAMHNLITLAQEEKAKSIQLVALSPRCAKWYENELMFKHTNALEKRGQTYGMIMFEENFGPCLDKLAGSLALKHSA